MAKILIVSHSPYSSTGYGRVVRALAGSLMAAGNQIICLGMGSKPTGKPLPYPVLPWAKLSTQAIGNAIEQHHIEVLLTIGDPWMFEGTPKMPQIKRVVWLAYYPVDGYPLPGAWKQWARAVDVPVVFSKFAREVVGKATGKPPELIYHGVNTHTFSPADREKSKELAHLAGYFVVGTVARNQLRKNIPVLVKAFARFSADKDDVLLYLHTQMKGEYDIPELVANAGIGTKTRITGEIAADKGVSDHLLATVYRAMDLFVLPTMAEGFGLPIMESQACGTPALVTDFSACRELVPDPIQRLKVKATLTMARNFEQAIVDEDDLVEKLEVLYRDRQRLKELGERCHQFARTFDWDIAYRQFNELIASERFQKLLAARHADREKPMAAKTAASAGPFSQKPIGTISSTNSNEKTNSTANVQPAQAKDPLTEVEQLHTSAVEKMKAGAVGEAAVMLRRIVELRPRNPDFQNQLAVALQSDGNLPEAIQHYRRSVELRPGLHQVWTNLGLACLRDGKMSEAQDACERALKLAPRSGPAHDLKGSLLLIRGEVDEARQAFRRALKFQPNLQPASIHLAEIAGMGEMPDPPTARLAPCKSGLTEENALQRLDVAVAALTPYPGGFEGRGVVIVGGGIRYFPCAWICIRMLRENGCTLPIELWHLGPDEITEEMSQLVAEHGVQCVDGQQKATECGAGELDGWELKSFAILHSRFRELLYLDADNFPLIDPTNLFETVQYKAFGVVFWPDYGKIKPSNEIWKLTGVAYRDEPAFESGQILIDKSRCWEPLTLTLWLNQNSDFWYRYLLGDKDTFHLAWRKLGRDYAMPEEKVAHLQYAMGQHDFDGRRIFQHRNRAKWVLAGWNPKTEDFEKEERGFALLEELRQRWKPRIVKYDLSATRRLQAAWKQHSSNTCNDRDNQQLLSISVTDPLAWELIGKVATHAARFIDDAHTLNLTRQAIDAAPELAELHAVMGTSLGAMGLHRKAGECFERAFGLYPNLPGLESNLQLARSEPVLAVL